jgi:hypothetical protein
MIRNWFHRGIVADVNQFAAELDRRVVPQLKGKKGGRRNSVVHRCRTALELARRLKVDRKQNPLHDRARRARLLPVRRKIVFHPDVVERAVCVLKKSY